ncbi:MAG TPA: nitroreductase [Magnetospirillaceae bacterium]|jgi:nitroreductase
MDIVSAIVNRSSPAQLVDPSPSDDQFEQILLAAVSAPDHARLRPWRFVVIKGDARLRFGELMAQSLKRREPGAAEDRLEAERKKALRAPLIVIIAAAIQENPKVPGVEQILAAGAAAQNMMIAAEALGFGILWRTGPVAYDEAVKAAFGLAEADAIVGIMYIGTVAMLGKPRPALDIVSVTRYW